MVMLTEVLRFQVRDEKGRNAPVSDLSIALLDDDYPPIKEILVKQDGDEKQLNWSEVRSVDLGSCRIVLHDITKATPPDDGQSVRLRRDVLDSLVLDLLGRRTTRVCDLLLEKENNALRLKGADTGFKAM